MSITTFGLMDEINRLQEENAELRLQLEEARADLAEARKADAARIAELEDMLAKVGG